MRSLLRFGALGCALALTALPLAISGGTDRRRRLLLAGHGQRVELDQMPNTRRPGEHTKGWQPFPA